MAYYSLYIILHSEIRTNLSHGHPLIPDKRGLTVVLLTVKCVNWWMGIIWASNLYI